MKCLMAAAKNKDAAVIYGSLKRLGKVKFRPNPSLIDNNDNVIDTPKMRECALAGAC